MPDDEGLRERALRLLLAIPDSEDRITLVATWLAAERRQAAAESLREAADDLPGLFPGMVRHLYARADALAADGTEPRPAHRQDETEGQRAAQTEMPTSTTPMTMTDSPAPAGDSRAEAREQIAKWLFTRFDGHAVTSWHQWWASGEAKCWLAAADAVLAAPAVAEALAARARTADALDHLETLALAGPKARRQAYGEAADILRKALGAS